MTTKKTGNKQTTTSAAASTAALPTASYELVTPDVARAMLANNENNRFVRKSRVRAYAAQMKGGSWHVTHQGVAIGADGSLYDAQHRLMAVIESGVSVWMLVVRGLSAAARAEIDTGDKRRVADTIRIMDGTGHNNVMTAAARVLALVSGDTANTGQRLVTVDEHRETFRRFEDGFEAVEAVFPSPIKRITRAPLLAALVFAYKTDPDGVVKAAVDLRDGAALPSGDPILALRNALLSTTGKHDTQESVFFQFKRSLAALDARLRGASMAKSVVRDGTLAGNRVFERFAAVNNA
mgnify:FL=1